MWTLPSLPITVSLALTALNAMKRQLSRTTAWLKLKNSCIAASARAHRAVCLCKQSISPNACRIASCQGLEGCCLPSQVLLHSLQPETLDAGSSFAFLTLMQLQATHLDSNSWSGHTVFNASVLCVQRKCISMKFRFMRQSTRVPPTIMSFGNLNSCLVSPAVRLRS